MHPSGDEDESYFDDVDSDEEEADLEDILEDWESTLGE